MSDRNAAWGSDDGLDRWLAEPDPTSDVHAHLAASDALDDAEFDARLKSALASPLPALTRQRLIDGVLRARAGSSAKAA